MKNWISLFLDRLFATILGLYIALMFVPQVSFSGSPINFILAGCLLGILNATLIPLLKILTTPLRILSLGTLNLIINMGFIWGILIIFPNLNIPLITPLLLTTLIISSLNFLLAL